MEILPEIWRYHIISYLLDWDKRRLRLVNKWFKSLVESVWKPLVDYSNLAGFTIEPDGLILSEKYSDFNISELTSLKELIFFCAEPSRSGAEKFLSTLPPRLEILYLANLEEFPPLILPSTLQQLRILSSPQLPAQHLAHLPPSLRVLEFDCGAITDEELQMILSPLTNLEHLSIDNCENITERGFTFLPRTLRSFRYCNISPDQLRLSYLGIMNNSITTIKNTSVQFLQVAYCSNLKSISSQIERLEIIRCPLLSDLSALTSLQVLDLVTSNITKYPDSLTSLKLFVDRDEDLIALQSLTNLRTLHLSTQTNITCDLFKYLPTTLTTLNLDWNAMFDRQLRTPDFQYFTAKYLQYLPSSIRFLNLKRVELDASAWEYLRDRDIIVTWRGNSKKGWS